MFDFTEFNKLVNMCADVNWDIRVGNIWEGQQVVLYKNGKRINDAVIHNFSYGHSNGLLETWENYHQEDVVGCLNAEEVFAIWGKDMAEA